MPPFTSKTDDWEIHVEKIIREPRKQFYTRIREHKSERHLMIFLFIDIAMQGKEPGQKRMLIKD